MTYEGEEYVLLAFRTAGQNDPDAEEPLQLLDMILDNADGGSHQPEPESAAEACGAAGVVPHRS